jgi:hypothetical protein
LLHTVDQPLLKNKTIRARHRAGAMACTTLLPQDAVHKLVGGPGQEFWAAGKNWDIVTDGLTEENLALIGRWRVEVSPGGAREKDVFLHVIQVGDADLAEVSDVELTGSDEKPGVKIRTGSAQWEILFNAEGALGGHIERSGGGRPIDRELTTTVQKQVGITAQE